MVVCKRIDLCSRNNLTSLTLWQCSSAQFNSGRLLVNGSPVECEAKNFGPVGSSCGIGFLA